MATDSKIEPALTAEEWARSELLIDPEDDPKHRHQYAALALHGQTYGFTRDDVIGLQNEAVRRENRGQDGSFLRDLADRIEALLPPEE